MGLIVDTIENEPKLLVKRPSDIYLNKEADKSGRIMLKINKSISQIILLIDLITHHHSQILRLPRCERNLLF